MSAGREPTFTFSIRDPGEWLSVVLLLFVGIVVGQLAALQRARTEMARAREQEAVALFRVSRELATRESTLSVLPTIADILRSETGMRRVWLALGGDDATERVAADTADATKPGAIAIHRILRRMPGDIPAEWVRIHHAVSQSRPQADAEAYRIRITSGQQTFGSIWGLQEHGQPLPGRAATRLLAAAADQIGQALAHDRLAAEAQAAEIVRQSDELKSALLQSVSHDLRTPLATIRAAAGTLRPGSGLSADDQRESAEAIDREVDYLNRLVTNLLDLSRIEAGALRAERDVFDLDDLLGQTLERLRARLGRRPLAVSLEAPPVLVDPILVDEAVANVLDNSLKYSPVDAPLRITAAADAGDRTVRLTIEDGGRGVPPETLPRVFEKFYRVPSANQGSRSGTGIGLAVTRGLIEATGGTVEARQSELGGLAVDITLPRATVPSELLARIT